MQRIVDESISTNERNFIRQAISQDLRIDGRNPYTHRDVTIELSTDDSSATVQLGETRVATVVTAALEAPYPDRQREGSIRFNVELSPMASPTIEAGRPGELGIELARLLERAIKQSGAVDVEALCVAPGRKVWALRVDSHVLNHAGNLVDACLLSATAALAAFKLPVVTLDHSEGGEGAIVVHSPDVREPQPLSIHHLVFPATFALFQEGNQVALDPSLAEEVAADGTISLMMTPKEELCGVQKADGIGLDHHQLMRCVRLAASSVQQLSIKLQDALKVHAAARVQERIRRRAAGPSTSAGVAAAAGGGGGGGAGVVVLADTGAADARLQALLQEIQELSAQRIQAQQQQQQQSPDAGMAAAAEGPGHHQQHRHQQQPGDEAAAARGAAAQQQQQQQQQQQRQGVKRGPASPGVGAGARLVGAPGLVPGSDPSTNKDLEEIFGGLNTSGSTPGAGRRRGVGASSPVPLDQLGEISQIIAGGAGGQQVTDLSGAIKHKAGKKGRHK